MGNLQKSIIKERSKDQHQLKNKNGNDGFKTIRGHLVDAEYCRDKGKGSYCKGLKKICIEHKMMTQMLNNINNEGISVKQEIITNFANDFLDNIGLVCPELASNHLSNLPALLNCFLNHNKWDPNKFLGVVEKNESK